MLVSLFCSDHSYLGLQMEVLLLTFVLTVSSFQTSCSAGLAFGQNQTDNSCWAQNRQVSSMLP